MAAVAVVAKVPDTISLFFLSFLFLFLFIYLLFFSSSFISSKP